MGIVVEKPRARILVVDDEASICRLVALFLEKKGYSCTTCESPAEAMAQIESGEFELVVSDVMMPGMTGIELLARAKKTHPDTAFIMLTALDDHETAVHALELGAYGYVIKPFGQTELLINVANSLRRRQLEVERNLYENQLEELVQARTAETRATQEQITLRLVAASEYRDEETGEHIRRIGEYSGVLARALGWDPVASEDMRLAAPMHDVGKIGVADAVLRKPGKLSPEEFNQIKEHTTIGARILEGSQIALINLARDIALSHHEKFDGSGYPRGLRGEDIPICARIVAVCDVYDALVSKRVYRPAMPEEKALAIMKEGRGQHFDPKLFDLFLERLPEFHAIRERLGDETRP